MLYLNQKLFINTLNCVIEIIVRIIKVIQYQNPLKNEKYHLHYLTDVFRPQLSLANFIILIYYQHSTGMKISDTLVPDSFGGIDM